MRCMWLSVVAAVLVSVVQAAHNDQHGYSHGVSPQLMNYIDMVVEQKDVLWQRINETRATAEELLSRTSGLDVKMLALRTQGATQNAVLNDFQTKIRDSFFDIEALEIAMAREKVKVANQEARLTSADHRLQHVIDNSNRQSTDMVSIRKTLELELQSILNDIAAEGATTKAKIQALDFRTGSVKSYSDPRVCFSETVDIELGSNQTETATAVLVYDPPGVFGGQVPGSVLCTILETQVEPNTDNNPQPRNPFVRQGIAVYCQAFSDRVVVQVNRETQQPLTSQPGPVIAVKVCNFGGEVA